MSDAQAKKESTPAAGTGTSSTEPTTSKVPQLGALEEDDEFEEFPVEGKVTRRASISTFHYLTTTLLKRLGRIGNSSRSLDEEHRIHRPI